ncbi:MAG: hypothetical protein ACRENG_34375 [bacterium]
MSISLTFEELEQQVTQLPPQQQLRLLARISEKLSAFKLNLVPAKENEENRMQQERATKFEAWLAECDRVAELWEGTFDSAADLRRLRNEE